MNFGIRLLAVCLALVQVRGQFSDSGFKFNVANDIPEQRAALLALSTMARNTSVLFEANLDPEGQPWHKDSPVSYCDW